MPNGNNPTGRYSHSLRHPQVTQVLEHVVLSEVPFNASRMLAAEPPRFARMVETYRDQLAELDPATPRILSWEVTQRTVMFTKERVGSVLPIDRLTNDASLCLDFCSQVLAFAQRAGLAGVGLDPKPSNFVLLLDRYVYVDFVFPYATGYLDWVLEYYPNDSPLVRSLRWFYWPCVAGHVFHDFARDFPMHEERLRQQSIEMERTSSLTIEPLWTQCEIEHRHFDDMFGM